MTEEEGKIPELMKGRVREQLSERPIKRRLSVLLPRGNISKDSRLLISKTNMTGVARRFTTG